MIIYRMSLSKQPVPSPEPCRASGSLVRWVVKSSVCVNVCCSIVLCVSVWLKLRYGKVGKCLQDYIQHAVFH